MKVIRPVCTGLIPFSLEHSVRRVYDLVYEAPAKLFHDLNFKLRPDFSHLLQECNFPTDHIEGNNFPCDLSNCFSVNHHKNRKHVVICLLLIGDYCSLLQHFILCGGESAVTLQHYDMKVSCRKKTIASSFANFETTRLSTGKVYVSFLSGF